MFVSVRIKRFGSAHAEPFGAEFELTARFLAGDVQYPPCFSPNTSQICIRSVDFPMPGSPESRTTEP